MIAFVVVDHVLYERSWLEPKSCLAILIRVKIEITSFKAKFKNFNSFPAVCYKKYLIVHLKCVSCFSSYICFIIISIAITSVAILRKLFVYNLLTLLNIEQSLAL